MSEAVDARDVAAALRALAKAVRRWRRRAELEARFPESQRRGDVALGEQLLYERWLKRDRWRLCTEGLPLVFGVDPAGWELALADTEVRAAHGALWTLIETEPARAGRLPILNPGVDPSQWCVDPAALAHWARAQGHALPGAFEALVQFIQRVVPRGGARPPVAVPLPGGWPSEELPASGTPREQVLGAALAIVSKWPEEFRDGRGCIDAGRVVERMRRQAAALFEAPDLPLPPEEAAALIERWLQ